MFPVARISRMAAGMFLLAGLWAFSPGSIGAVRFPLLRGPWVLESPAGPNRHVEALGEQAGVWGSLTNGFESWVYPFKLFDSWSLFIERAGESPQPLHWFAKRQIATPHCAQLEFSGGGWRMTTTWFVPRSLPGALLLLDYEGAEERTLILRFRPSLAPMHLKPAGPLASSWEDSRRELLVREANRGLELRVNCPFAVNHRETGGGQQEIRITLPRRLPRNEHVPIAISLGAPERPEARATVDHLLSNTAGLWREAMEHYAQRIARAPQVQTPDRSVNDALVWSVVSLDQLRIRHPDLGFGLVSGYSSSGTGTRPRYCWFFEEPTLTSVAYHWLGMSEYIRESLLFLQRFQRNDGKTVHEVVQSLPYWKSYFEEFLYAYLHSDGPVYYLFAYGDYYRATGDFGFIQSEWTRIRRTLGWCLSAADPKDGLMRIDPGDWGSAESSRDAWKDTQLQGMWVRALRGMAPLAKLAGESALAEQCEQVARQAAASIEAQMWDEQAGVYFWGLDRQGRPLRSLVPHHSVSFWLGSLPVARIERSLERMASADFRSDWGVRSLALSDPKYDPANYQAGSVWPVWNAGVIISDYRHDRSVEGYRNLRSMIRARLLEGLGPMPEVLNGGVFQRLEEGVPHQMFSELAVVNGFFEGLLGLEVDVPARRISVAPRLPPGWNALSVERIPCGPGSFALRIERSKREYRISFDVQWPGGAQVELAPELPAGSEVRSVRLDRREVAYDRQEATASTRIALKLNNVSGQHLLAVRHQSGVDWLPVDEPLTLAVTNRNVRVIRARWENSCWRFELEGLPGREYPIAFFTERSVVSATSNLRIEKRKEGSRVDLTAPPNAATNAAGYVRWNSEVYFR